ncbi:MAG: hypothetical protein HZB42_03325 [Sphingobacteriales bacterium]|nr:hypothetical protein [Sphingobacteriales bacterium]
MRIIKLGLISIVAFAVLITGISLFFPSHVRISKAIDILTEKDSVMSLVGDVRNWKKWYPGADTAFYIAEKGKIKGIATGEGQGLIITSFTDSSVNAMNTGAKSKRGETGWNIFSGSVPNTITIQWFRDFHLRWYPWEKFSGLLLEKRYGPLMEKGLENLKKLLEK